MTVTSQHYGFFVEGLTEEAAAERSPRDEKVGASSLPWIEVPSGDISFLAAPAGGPPRVSSQPSEGDAQLGVLDTVRHERQTYLTLLPKGELRLNAQPVPPVAVLRVGDQVRIGGDWLLYVSRFTRPRIGPVPEEYVGRACSYCRIEFDPTTVSYICPNCGTPVHCESKASKTDDESEPLECARLMSECHHCHQPIVLTERYEYVPER